MLPRVDKHNSTRKPKLTAQEKSSELLVGGVPTGSEDLQGWTAFDNFMKDIID